MSDFLPERHVSVRYWIVRKTFFTARYRRQFYTAIHFLLTNDKPLEVALNHFSDVYTDFGRRWHPYQELIQDCLEALADNGPGRTLQDVLAAWGPLEEAALISAGMRGGSLPMALLQANKLIQARRRISLLMLQMSVYPLVLMVFFCGLLFINSQYLTPVLRKMSDPANWTGGLWFINGMASLTESYGVISAVGLVLLVLWILWSLPRWRKHGRKHADHIVPWSIYKDIQGAVFLMNVSALIRANVITLDALETLYPFASPWLQERLDKIIEHVNEGEHLGLALRNCGYDFPSRQGANFLSLLTQGDGAPEVISNFADEWLQQTLDRVKARVYLFMGFSLLLIFGFFLLILLIVMQIQDMTNYMH